MDLPVRKKIPHTIPQWVADGSWFFITIKCVPPGKNQLCRADVGDAVLAAMKYNHDKLVWHCRLCLLMPDHLHAILAFPREPGMETVVKNWKKFVAGKHGVDWQRDFFDHRLRDHHELEEKTSYILMNPVRKGLCERAKIGCGSIIRTTVRRRCSGRASLAKARHFVRAVMEEQNVMVASSGGQRTARPTTADDFERLLVRESSPGKSGRGLPQSKTLARERRRMDGAKRLGVRQCSGAL